MPSFTREVKKVLLAAGCGFERQGKGHHEIWFSPRTGVRLPVDGDIRSRHTSSLVLKQAGLPKAFKIGGTPTCLGPEGRG